MADTQKPIAGERTQRIKNPSPQVSADYAEQDGNYREAARLFKEAGDLAGGHTHAANMYAKAKQCLSKLADPKCPLCIGHGYTTAHASACSCVRKPQFGKHYLGIVLDCSAQSADTLNERTINFAESFGFRLDAPLPDTESEDYSEALSEEADNAVAWLNAQDNIPYCYWSFEENSLFYLPSVESASEDVGFKSSKTEDYPSADYRGEWLHVNDHGNATLYVRDENSNDREIWSVV